MYIYDRVKNRADDTDALSSDGGTNGGLAEQVKVILHWSDELERIGPVDKFISAARSLQETRHVEIRESLVARVGLARAG